MANDFIKCSNVTINVLCLFCGIICYFVKRLDKTTSNTLFMLFLLNFLLTICDLFIIFFEGDISTFARIIIPIAFFIQVILHILIWFAFTKYFIAQTNLKNLMGLKTVLNILLFVFCVLVVINIPLKFLYYVDNNNVCHNGVFYIVHKYIALTYVLFVAVIFGLSFKKLTKIDKFAFSLFICISLISIILQIVFGVNLCLVCIMLILVVLFFFSVSKTLNNYHQQRIDLMDMQTKIMISQIQPHFLYNSLTAIMAICDDSNKTKQSIADFSKYLRGNLDALRNDRLIPFTKELSHVETYLRLEKLRFEDALTIIYDITATNFMLPALTVQVLVENAVKHGITKSKGSGYVKISTKELVKCYVITVEDNGQGFDITSVDNDGQSHYGLKNIANRLKYLCNGKLNVESKINVGTTATVTIYKQ